MTLLVQFWDSWPPPITNPCPIKVSFWNFSIFSSIAFIGYIDIILRRSTVNSRNLKYGHTKLYWVRSFIFIYKTTVYASSSSVVDFWSWIILYIRLCSILVF
jgi:hypothetical protein